MLELSYTHVRADVTGDVVRVTLNRPEMHNAFNEDVILEITDCFERIGRDEETRLVVLTGAGKSFCAGGDLNWMQKSVSFTKKKNLEDARRLSTMLHTVNRCPKPVVARVNGNALGGGCGLIAVCDIAVASEDALFGFTEVKLGIVPAAIGPFAVRKIGESHARRHFLLGDRFGAREAVHIGLVHDAVPAAKLDATVDGVVRSLRTSGPRAMGEAKALVRTIVDMPATADKACVETIARLRVGAEGQEGLKAFLEKRRAKWART
ncbi:MAG: enoyl-CoA hydratase/isomerase family protein [Candidatus Brocadiae bacterium]|nr:enoyl-CoA hydratase/isomerase family protein [Candidatus Brocadiia bacterium]